MSRPSPQSQLQHKLLLSHPASSSLPDPCFDTVGDSEGNQRGRSASNKNTPTSGPASETVIQLSVYDPSLELTTFVPVPSTDHPENLHDYSDGTNTARRSDLERAPTLLNRMSWASFGLGSLTRRGSNATPIPNTISRQGSKDSGRTLTMGPDQYPVRQETKGSINACPPPPGDSLQLQIPPPTLSTDPAPLNSTRASSTFLHHTLTPAALPPPPALSPTGKRYIDTRKHNKKFKQGRKEAFRTAKVLFSNERTFIHWIKFGMLLGALAMILLNFSGQAAMTRPVEHDLIVRAEMIGQRVGMALMAICLMCLVYAACIFHWRHIGVAGRKDDDRYFDRIGPTVVTLGLLGTYSINVILTILVTSKLDPSYSPSVFYNTNSNSINTGGITPNQAAPVRPSYGLPQPPVFDNGDDGEEAIHEFKPNVEDEDEDDSDTSYPSSDWISSAPPSSSAASTQDESSPDDGRDSSSENANGQVSDQDD
ncbi:hypothetical protein BGZ93_006950 [Podila epicladia]|nr:hypothetical protein BGZ92_011302 [Podila epicladia]KAG0094637.1 hypothetical protein BGZ93_006950 [Podila epicladia]